MVTSGPNVLLAKLKKQNGVTVDNIDVIIRVSGKDAQEQLSVLASVPTSRSTSCHVVSTSRLVGTLLVFRL